MAKSSNRKRETLADTANLVVDAFFNRESADHTLVVEVKRIGSMPNAEAIFAKAGTIIRQRAEADIEDARSDPNHKLHDKVTKGKLSVSQHPWIAAFNVTMKRHTLRTRQDGKGEYLQIKMADPADSSAGYIAHWRLVREKSPKTGNASTGSDSETLTSIPLDANGVKLVTAFGRALGEAAGANGGNHVKDAKAVAVAFANAITSGITIGEAKRKGEKIAA